MLGPSASRCYLALNDKSINYIHRPLISTVGVLLAVSMSVCVCVCLNWEISLQQEELEGLFWLPVVLYVSLEAKKIVVVAAPCGAFIFSHPCELRHCRMVPWLHVSCLSGKEVKTKGSWCQSARSNRAFQGARADRTSVSPDSQEASHTASSKGELCRKWSALLLGNAFA